MLLLFLLSITPKKYWHDLVANHTDYYSYHPRTETSVSNAGFDCDCNDLVVSTPFLETVVNQAVAPQIIYSSFTPSAYCAAASSLHTTKASRGPPGAAFSS